MSEAICFVIDVGDSASQQPTGGDSFLKAALGCASMIVERRIFSESKDEFGVVLFGCEESNNPLEYENVKVLERGFCRADWDTVKYLKEHVEGTRVEGDWIDGVVVALHILREENKDKQFAGLKIVLMSDLGCTAGVGQMDLICKALKETNVEFHFFGPKWSDGQNSQNGDNSPRPSTSRGEPEKNETSSKPQTSIQRENDEVLDLIIAETSGVRSNLEEVVFNFIVKNKKEKKSAAFKVVLTLGPEIGISVTGYKLVDREPPKTWKKCLARDDSHDQVVANNSVGNIPSTVGRDSLQLSGELKPDYKQVTNDEHQTEVEPTEIINAYRYGDFECNITETDEEAVKFDGGPKSLCLFGFINRDQIKFEDLVGDSSMAFIPTENDDQSSLAMSVLAQAMMEEGVVAIVRKVYRRGVAPRLGVMVPEEDAHGTFFAFAELPFSEERRELQFPSLVNRRNPITQDHLDAVDSLIDSLDLEVVNEEGETEILLDPETIRNPEHQYLYDCLTQKALYPNRPLPVCPPRLTECLRMPEDLTAGGRLESILGRIRTLFPLQEVQEKKAKRTGEKVFGGQDDDGEPDAKKAKLANGRKDEEEVERAVTSVGTVNPVEDFSYLLSHNASTGASIESTGLQLESVIERLLASAFGTDLNAKIVNCLLAYRNACKDLKVPAQYNEFIRQLKEKVGERLWSDVVAADAGLLRASEVFDGVNDDEAEAFIRPKDENDAGDVQAGEDDEEEDVMDLI